MDSLNDLDFKVDGKPVDFDVLLGKKKKTAIYSHLFVVLLYFYRRRRGDRTRRKLSPWFFFFLFCLLYPFMIITISLKTIIFK